MDLLRRSDLDRLLEVSATPTVSLFMPTYRVGKEKQQNPVRLRKMLDEAEARLKTMALDGATARSVLEPGRELISEGGFWRRQGEGLAMFLAPGLAKVFRLPVGMPELVVAGERFHVRPLLPALWPDQPFYVLALSRAGVRLLRGSRYHVERIPLVDVPATLDELLRYIDEEKQVKSRVTGRRGGARSGYSGGQDEGGDAEEVRVAEYLRRVAYGVGKTLNANGEAPLVLAAVEKVQAIYRDVAGYPPVYEQAIPGNPDRLSDEELRARAWALVEPLARRRMEEDGRRYRLAAGRGEAPEGMEATLLAALQGRVEALFVCRDEVVWGRFNPDTGETETRPDYVVGCEDLLDRAAALTIAAKGVVYSVSRESMPTSEPVAALPRF